jgi:hypothetical protein
MEKITIDLQAKTDKAVKEIEDLKKEIEKLNKAVEAGNKDTKDGLDSISKASNNTTKGLKKIGTTLKAGVLGIFILAFDKIKELFSQNQVVLDTFNIGFEALSLAFNDFFNFISSNAGKVINAFKSIFKDPVQSIIDFKDALVEGVIDRFNQLVETLGFVAKGIGDLFKGNFKDAVENFKQAGKESIDIITGQDKSFEQVKETLGNVVDATKNYVKETVNSAKANVELQKSAERARVINQGLIEDYDRQAEQQRQLRDNEFKTIEERIAANDKLKGILEEQATVMQENADVILAAAQAQYDKNQSEENFIALQEAKNEKLGIEAQITGFMSEQDSNRNALLREKLELEQSNTDATAERQKAERDFQAEQIEGEFLRIEKQIENAEIERQIEQKRLEDKKALYKEGTQAFADADNELKAYKQEADRIELANEKKLQDAKQNLITGALGNLATIVGKNSKFGKAIAIVQAIRDTFAGANKALASAPPPFNFISAAAVVAAGIANVKSITSTKEPTPPAGIGARSSGGGVGAQAIPSAPPAFNVVGASETNQLANAISEQVQQPVKAFVVSNDVSTAQELDRNIVQGAAIG